MKYVRFFGNAGYSGTDYEDYEAFDEDDLYDGVIDEESAERAYDNAENYSYLMEDYDDVLSEKDIDSYYENALENCGWEYVSEEEYKEWIGE